MSDDLPIPLPAPDNPAAIFFPPTMPYELAMKTGTPREIAEAYGYTKDEFFELIQHPVFQKAFADAQEALRQDGASFRVKAKMQAEAYLQTAYQMVQDPETADSVRADLIKSTVKWGGLEPKTGADAGNQNNFQINIQL